MRLTKQYYFDDLDFKIHLGGLEINILYIHFVPPIPTWTEINHSHTGYELHFVPSGRGVLSANHTSYAITPSTFYLTGPGVYHAQKTDFHDPMTEYCINFEIKRRKAKGQDPKIPPQELEGLERYLQETTFWFGSDTYNACDLFERIFAEFQAKRLGYYIAVKNYIEQIIISSARYYMGRQEAAYTPPYKTLYQSRLRTLDTYLYQDYAKTTALDTIAKNIGVSPRQLQRIIKEYYKMSFKQKVTSIRLENAKNLLLYTDLSTEEIAERVGFSSASHLSFVFKRQEALTPYQFKKRNKHVTDRAPML